MKIQSFEKKNSIFFKLFSVSHFMNVQEDPRNNKSMESGFISMLISLWCVACIKYSQYVCLCVHNGVLYHIYNVVLATLDLFLFVVVG